MDGVAEVKDVESLHLQVSPFFEKQTGILCVLKLPLKGDIELKTDRSVSATTVAINSPSKLHVNSIKPVPMHVGSAAFHARTIMVEMWEPHKNALYLTISLWEVICSAPSIRRTSSNIGVLILSPTSLRPPSREFKSRLKLGLHD